MAVTAEIACKQGCGKTFTTEGWRVKHELKCQGKPATQGRIAARGGDHIDRTPPAAKARSLTVPRSSRKTVAKQSRRRPDQTRREAQAFNELRHVELIEELKGRRDRIQAAIDSLEAIG